MDSQTLGDAWGADTPPDAPSPFSMDYYRRKAVEFQQVLDALDRSYWAASGALGTGALDEATATALEAALADYESRKGSLRLTAEAINAGAAAINSMGGRFPRLSIPGTLGLPPLLAPAAMVAAIGTAAALIAWGSQWIAGVNERLRRAQIIEGTSPANRDAIVRAIAESDNAVNVAEGSFLASLAPTVKWVAIGIGAFLLYRAYSNR
jgi:hypothetical protein